MQDRRRERRRAAPRDERSQSADVERQIERESQGVESHQARPLELVEPPFENGVRGRTLELHANARSSGCRKHHGRAIGRSRRPA